MFPAALSLKFLQETKRGQNAIGVHKVQLVGLADRNRNRSRLLE